MCAISGFTFKNQNLINKMNQILLHRGPDDVGTFVNDNISLGSRRLSILDLSPAGHMPMSTPDGRYTIVFNGEIYNYQELKKPLAKSGYPFKSTSDTEVILAGFAKYGSSFIKRLNGMFALAIYDQQTNSLLLARDRVGIKPLYYTIADHQLIFASEVKAILAHRLKPKISLKAFNLYCRLLYVPAPHTIYENIYQLLPGHLLTFHQGKIDIKPFYQPQINIVKRSSDELIDQVHQTLKASVRRNLISDRPVGFFLSGGIDSSLVLAMSAPHISGNLKTYTTGFEVGVESEKFNRDLVLARTISKKFNTDHHELVITATDLKDNFENMVYHLDDPFGNPTQIAPYLLSKLARQQTTVLLSGDGGDELFAGYSRYSSLYYLHLYNQLPRLFKNNISHFVNPFAKQLAQKLTRINVNTAVDMQNLLMGQSEQLLTSMINPEINDNKVVSDFFQPYLSGPVTELNQYLLADLQTWLPSESLVKSDKLTMAQSIEQRVPLLDNEMIDLALSIDFSQKLSLKSPKLLLRQIARDYLPSEITEAKKWGWFSPIAKWMRTDLKSFTKDHLNNPLLKEYFDTKKANQLLQRHLQGEYHPHTLWSLVVFSQWLNQFNS